MATTATQQAPKAAKQASLVFYHETYFHIETKTKEIIAQYQAAIDRMDPDIQAVIQEQFEGRFSDMEAEFRKVRVKSLPGYQDYENAGIDLTGQVKLKPAEIEFLEELRNPSWTLGDFHVKPKGSFRLKEGKICIENTQQLLDGYTLTLSGFEVEVFNSLTKFYESLIQHKANVFETERAAWFIPPHMLQDARYWTLEGKACIINPTAVKRHVGLLPQFN